jgi:hypothetical protein
VLHTQDDRAEAFAKLEAFIDQYWDEEEEQAFDEFWDEHGDWEEQLSPEFLEMSRGVQEPWFAFDHRLDDGTRVVDELLAQLVLTAGERSFLRAMRNSTMRLYEVRETIPGSSMTLRDLIEGNDVTVSERTGSRTMSRRDCIAARVIRGCSGKPEMERGVLHIPGLYRDQLVATIHQHRSEFASEHPGESFDRFYKLLPPLVHEVWLKSIFEPAVPRLNNTDGEEMTVTRVTFHVENEATLARELDGAGAEGLTRAGDHTWSWCGPSASRSEVSLGTVELRAGILTVETNSVERGTRARELVERLVGQAARHRGTTHEDLQRLVRESVTARMLGREEATEAPSPHALDPDVAEALVADHYARHYRSWVDEPVPALDGSTPRQAGKNRALRPRLEDLIRDLEGMYERALKEGQPAYDPSWMWAELEIEPVADLARPPALAHERVAEQVPGSADASRSAAERFRAVPSFSDATTTVTDEELRLDLELQRFVRSEKTSEHEATSSAATATPYIGLMVNLDLHRRKVFWVDAALSFMLENTDLDVAGRELRVPFPSFALVFTDRHTLSIAERLLSRSPEDPLRGQLLRVLTVYVTERQSRSGRTLSVVFACDALGADLPSLVRYEVPADDEASLRTFLASVAPPSTIVEPQVRDTNPTRGLLRVTLNAILYATSAGVTPEVRPIKPRARSSSASHHPAESDSIFFLPGKIDIRHVRQLQELQRAPDGSTLLARFMVRGHWRRPAKSWAEQQLRWIEPYWKGPDMATVIEKAYRMKA